MGKLMRLLIPRATLVTLFCVVTPAAVQADPAPGPAPAPAPKMVAPKLVDAKDVPYPDGATGDADVVLRLLIDPTGTVTEVTVESGAEPFAAQAKAGVMAFRFSPATRDGVPIKAQIRYKLTFAEPTKVEAPAPAPTPAEPAKPGEKPTSKAKVEEPTELTVLGDKPAPMVSTFSRAEIRELPGAFGDPFRAIESLPGVTPIVSGLPFFYVRGAPPGNVGYYLDGIRVPYLYHVGLGPSVIHPGMVDRVDLYPGGYPSRFGRFAGGIVSGEATAPRGATHGEGNIRLFDAGALVETGFANGKGTVLIGGRYSYTAAILSLVAKDTILDYRDAQVRVTYDLTDRDRLTLFGFGAYDLLAQRQQGAVATIFGSEFYRADLRWDHTFSKGTTVRVAGTLGFDQTKLGETRNVQDKILGARVEVRHAFGPKLAIRGGLDTTFDSYQATKPKYVDPESPDAIALANLFPARTDSGSGLWLDLPMTPSPNIEFTPGIRFDMFRQSSVTKTAVDPRLSMRFKINDRLKLLHAYGLAHQAPSFAVPIPGLTPATLSGGLQSAYQASAGVEVALPEEITATASVFHNSFFGMTDAIGSSTGRSRAGLEEVRTRGRAYGFELFIRRRLTKKLGGYVSYTLSRSTRDIDGSTVLATTDRTHVASTSLGYDLGRKWRLGAKFTYYTGLPRTSTVATATGSATVLTGERDPAYWRLDARLEKRWNLTETRWISFVAEMLNTTLNKETIGGVAVGPVAIPSLGVEGGF